MSDDPVRDEIDWSLLERSITGELTSGEAARVADLLCQRQELRLALNAFVAELPAAGVEPVDDRQSLRVLHHRLFETPPSSRSLPASDDGTRAHRWRPGANAPGWRTGWRGILGASVAVMVGVAVCWSGWTIAHQAKGPPFRELVSAVGSRRALVLSDGTRLVLGPETQVRVPRDFGISTRTIELTGEAMFQVVHNAARPFAVRTGRTVVRDVGTVFIVRDYPGDEADRVVVQEGAVSLEACHLHGESVASMPTIGRCDGFAPIAALRSGDLATVSDTGVLVRHGAMANTLTAWLQGGLAFEKTPLREVVHDISRTFGVAITVADTSLLSQRITATVSNEPLDVVLDAITRIVGARFERTAHGVVIRKENEGERHETNAPRPPLTTASVEDQHA